MDRPRFWFLAALVLLAATSRVVPHPANFAPITAVALFGSAVFPARRTGLLVALASLLLGDMLLQLTYEAERQPHWGFYPGQWVVYACLVPTALIGLAIRGRRTFATVAAATLAGSVVFFLTTNLAAWAYDSGATYPRTAEGLLRCYAMAIPFFRNGLAGDAFYASVLFGSLALAERRVAALRPGSPAA